MASCVLQVQMPTDFGSNLGGRSSEALVSDWRPALPSPYPERFGIPELNPLMPNLSPTCSASSDANPKSSLSLLPCKPDPDSATFPMSCTNPFSVSNPSQSIYSSSSRSLVSADACPPVSKGNSCSAGYKSFASSQFFGSNNRLGLESPVLNVESESMPAAFMGQGSPSKISEPDHEVHIWTERERRKKMRGMFVTLHSMLPKVSAKADKSTIVDEAIVYIKSLEQDLQNLLKKRAQKMQAIGKYQNIAGQEGAANPELSPKATSIVTVGTENECFQSLCSPNIVFNVRGSDVFITICCFQRPNLLEKIFKFVILDYKLEVKNVQISDSSDTRRLFMIHARATEHSQLTESNLKLAIQDLTVSLALK